MSEATTTNQCTEAEWEAARSAGLLFATPGSSAQDAAIHKFAVAIQADLIAALSDCVEVMARIYGDAHKTAPKLIAARAAIAKATGETA